MSTNETARPGYKDLSAELTEIVAKLEQGDMDIEVALACYERGLGIVKELEAYLTKAENRVTELKASLESDGEE